MTLGKGHLILMLPFFLAALGYNIWHFVVRDEPAVVRRADDGAAPIAPSGPLVAGEASGAPIDPASIPPVPDVVLDRLPGWRRNPFVDARGIAPEPLDVDAVEAAQPAAEPDIVVEAIFVPAGRSPRARVNGETVRVGDRVGTATIVEIQPKAIVIDSPALGRRTIVPERRTAPVGSARGSQ